MRNSVRVPRFLLILSLLATQLRSQPALGSLRITVLDSHGWALSRGLVRLATPSGGRMDLPVANGVSTAALPAGAYCASVLTNGEPAYPCVCFRVSTADLVSVKIVSGSEGDGTRGAACIPSIYPAAYSVADAALSNDVSVVTYPFGWGGLSRPRLVSMASFSAAATRFSIDGVDATDPYQPGRAMVEVPPEFVGTLRLRPFGDPGSTQFHGSEIEQELRRPEREWHARIGAIHSGIGLSWNNLPPVAGRGRVSNPDRFFRFDRDTVEGSGPISKRINLLVGAAGQFASQTVPWSRTPEKLPTRSGSLMARAGVALGASELDLAFVGSGYEQPRWSLPPAFDVYRSYGIASDLEPVAGESSTERAMRFEAGSSTPVRFGGAAGTLEVRGAFSRGISRNASPEPAQARMELEGGPVAGVPFTGSARSRSAALETLLSFSTPGEARIRNYFQVGSSMEATGWRNLVEVPGGEHLWTAAGVPAFVVEYDRPSFATGGSGADLTVFARHRVSFGPRLSIDSGLVFTHASVSASSASSPDAARISWTSFSPRFGVSAAAPHFSPLVLRVSLSRTPQPLSGRTLDFLNPDGISGRVYAWDDPNRDLLLEPGERGSILRRFGAAYSSAPARVANPFADHVRASARLALPFAASFSVTGFRTDEKRRIALENSGVPFSAYDPVWIRDPGADFIPSTFDDQQILVFAQRAGTLGNDAYRLVNPAGLRSTTMGVSFEVAASTSRFAWRASYTKLKTFTPTNPGDSPWANDPEMIGSLYLSPNDLYHATGHSYFDRANVGHLWAHLNAPVRRGPSFGFIATYFDGAPFGRELLVTGLPQGPFLAAATLRGSPEGGHRTQFLLNTDLRVSQEILLHRGRVQAFLDCVNLLNEGNKIGESDISGPNFNLRLPLAIQPSRSIRVGLLYWF